MTTDNDNAGMAITPDSRFEIHYVGGDVLTQLRVLGKSRRDRWHTPQTEPWTGADWSNAMCGEAGEAANIVKKLRRIETGTGSAEGLSTEDLVEQLRLELADTIAYADLLAQHYGIDLRQAIADKFNQVSLREGFPERIDVPDVPTCRQCGCTDVDACFPSCWWIEPDLCSACGAGQITVVDR